MRRELIEELVNTNAFVHSLLFENRVCIDSKRHARPPSMACLFGKIRKPAKHHKDTASGPYTQLKGIF
jgi:hypothetical protein